MKYYQASLLFCSLQSKRLYKKPEMANCLDMYMHEANFFVKKIFYFCKL